MLLGFKTELKLNNLQRTVLLKHCGVSRHAWNWGLALTREILKHNSTNPDNKGLPENKISHDIGC